MGTGLAFLHTTKQAISQSSAKFILTKSHSFLSSGVLNDCAGFPPLIRYITSQNSVLLQYSEAFQLKLSYIIDESL